MGAGAFFVAGFGGGTLAGGVFAAGVTGAGFTAGSLISVVVGRKPCAWTGTTASMM